MVLNLFLLLIDVILQFEFTFNWKTELLYLSTSHFKGKNKKKFYTVAVWEEKGQEDTLRKPIALKTKSISE